jgi:hypothetical protein
MLVLGLLVGYAVTRLWPEWLNPPNPSVYIKNISDVPVTVHYRDKDFVIEPGKMGAFRFELGEKAGFKATKYGREMARTLAPIGGGVPDFLAEVGVSPEKGITFQLKEPE